MIEILYFFRVSYLGMYERETRIVATHHSMEEATHGPAISAR